MKHKERLDNKRYLKVVNVKERKGDGWSGQDRTERGRGGEGGLAKGENGRIVHWVLTSQRLPFAGFV